MGYGTVHGRLGNCGADGCGVAFEVNSNMAATASFERRSLTGSAPDRLFWAGKRVLVTGHTGFKGAWLCLLLEHLGAKVSGLALPGPERGAFNLMNPSVSGAIADIRDAAAVEAVVKRSRPEIVFHLAAQALVGYGYAHPVETFATNVMGTAHLLNAFFTEPPAATVVVTTDKVYANLAIPGAFSEGASLGARDPYGASKAAAEHVVAGLSDSLARIGTRIATARAGNVLGGGDCGSGRLVVDVLLAHQTGDPVLLRRPHSVRPWQYVLDVLAGYLLYAQALVQKDAPRAMNFGPPPDTTVTASVLTEQLQSALGGANGWKSADCKLVETDVLLLDSTLALHSLGWRTITPLPRAVAWTAEWHEAARHGGNMRRLGEAQIHTWASTVPTFPFEPIVQ